MEIFFTAKPVFNSVIIMCFISSLEKFKINQIAKEIISVIDRNNSALMYKGLSWMAKNYLINKNIDFIHN